MLVEKLINSIVSSDEVVFGELADKIIDVKKEYDTSIHELTTSQTLIKKLTTELENSKNSQMVPPVYAKELEKTVIDLQAQLKLKDSRTAVMPIITPEYKLTNTNLIVLREIKTAIYMNKLLEFILNTYKLSIKLQGKKCLLVILDPLVDELRLAKYQKHSYPINSFIPDVPMIITNKDSKELQAILNLGNYGEVTIVDRYMKLEPAVKHSRADVYYLVDSFTDVVDYNLGRDKCLAFVNSGETRFSNIVDPSVDISSYPQQEKAGIIAMCKLVERLYCHEI